MFCFGLWQRSTLRDTKPVTDSCPDQQTYKIITGLFSPVQYPQSFLCFILCILPPSIISHSSCHSPKWVCASTWKKCSADSFEHSWKYLQAQALPQLPTKEEPVSEPKFGLSPVLSLRHRICLCDPTGLPLHLLSPPLMCCAFAAACFHLSTISDIKIPLIFLTVF